MGRWGGGGVETMLNLPKLPKIAFVFLLEAVFLLIYLQKRYRRNCRVNVLTKIYVDFCLENTKEK